MSAVETTVGDPGSCEQSQKIVRIPIRVLQKTTAQAVHRQRMHAEKARDDLRLTTHQRPLRQSTQDLRNHPLALARRLVQMRSLDRVMQRRRPTDNSFRSP